MRQSGVQTLSSVACVDAESQHIDFESFVAQ
jgi:hypothetical protein